MFIQICIHWRETTSAVKFVFDYQCTKFLYALPAERFYHSVHNSQRPVSGLAGNGISRCPFRAAIQSQPQHTNAAPDTKTTATEAKTCLAPKEKCGYDEEHCRVKRSTEDGRCECAAQGLQPIGQSLSYCRLLHQHA